MLEVDRLFKEQSGWSILDKARSLPADSLKETQVRVMERLRVASFDGADDDGDFDGGV